LILLKKTLTKIYVGTALAAVSLSANAVIIQDVFKEVSYPDENNSSLVVKKTTSTISKVHSFSSPLLAECTPAPGTGGGDESGGEGGGGGGTPSSG
jgi:hypothetical protein